MRLTGKFSQNNFTHNNVIYVKNEIIHQTLSNRNIIRFKTV